MLPKISVLQNEARIRLDRLAEIRDMDVRKVNVQTRDEMAALVSELEQINKDIASEKKAMAIDEQFRSADSGVIPIAKTLPLNDRPYESRMTNIYQKSDEFHLPAESRNDNKRGVTMSSRFKNPGEFFSAIIDAGSPGRRFDERLFETRAVSGMNEGVPSAGGFLVDSGIANEIFKRAAEQYPVIGMCRRFVVGANQNGIKIPAIDETSRADGSRSGGVTSAWTGEGGEIAASKPKIRQMEITLNKLTGISYMTDELMQDTQNAGQIVIDAFADELGFKIQDAILNGNGAGRPLGIMQSGALVTQDKEAGQAQKTIAFENVLKMWQRMPAANRKNAAWFINPDIEQALYTMSLAIGTGGIPVWLAAGGASVNGYSQLFGRPVIPIEQCATLGTVGDIVLADMSQYAVLERNGLEVAQSLHIRFEFHEQAFRFIHRIGGQPLWSAPLSPKNGTNTQSPFITLATRA